MPFRHAHSSNKWPRTTLFWHCLLTAVVMMLVPMGMGCRGALPGSGAGHWAMDYDAAEEQVEKTGHPLLIFYRDARHGGEDDAMADALKSPSLAAATRGYVRCMLFRSYEPDRRYVAQYGVDRAPALVVVHGDATYHASRGVMSVAQIEAFLDEARAPGRRPTLNPNILRQARYPWYDSLDEAEAVAAETDRPMLIVFHRRLSRDWKHMVDLLTPHEVYSRLSGMVPVSVALHGLFTEAYITRFGALKLPAVAIAHPDGRYRVLEMPTSSEAVVRFADEAMRAASAGVDQQATTASTVSRSP